MCETNKSSVASYNSVAWNISFAQKSVGIFIHCISNSPVSLCFQLFCNLLICRDFPFWNFSKNFVTAFIEGFFHFIFLKKRPNQESNLGALAGQDFQSCAIPLCDWGTRKKY